MVIAKALGIAMDSIIYMQIKAQIDKLITELYVCYSQYAPFAITEGYFQRLMLMDNITELQTLPAHLISAQAIKAYLQYIDGDPEIIIAQIKYLLPRIIVLFNKGEEINTYLEMNFVRFQLNHTERWNQQEIKQIKKFAKLHFQKIIIEHDQVIYMPLEELLIMWTKAGLNTDFLLDTWLEMSMYPKAITNYVHLLNNFDGMKYSHPDAPNSFGNNIRAWAFSSQTINTFKSQLPPNTDSIKSLNEWEVMDYEFLRYFS